MPLSFAIPFAGSTIPIYTLHSYTNTTNNAAARSRYPRSRYEPFSFTSRSSTRFTTLATQSSALRDTAFARARGSPHGSHNLLLGLSMLSMLPLAIDMIYRNPRAHARQLSITADAITKEEDCVEESVYERLPESTSDPESLVRAPGMRNEQRQSRSEAKEWSMRTPTAPILSQGYAQTSKTPSDVPLRSSSKASTSRPGDAGTAPASVDLRICRRLGDRLGTRATQLVYALRPEAIAEEPFESQIEKASLLLAVLRGITQVNRERGRPALRRVRPRLLTWAITNLLSVMASLRNAQVPGSAQLEDALLCFMQDLAGCSTSEGRLESSNLPGAAIGIIGKYAMATGHVQLQAEALRLLLVVLHVEGWQDSKASTHGNAFLRESFASLSRSISATWYLPTQASPLAQTAYTSAIAAYSRCLDILEHSPVNDSVVLSGMLRLCLQLPAPPTDATAAQAIPPNGLGVTEEEQAGLLERIRQHHALVERTHGVLVHLLEQVINQSSDNLEPSRQRIVYSSRRLQWRLQRVHATEGSEIQQASLVKATTTITTLLSNRNALALLLQYAFAHLHSWQIGEQVYAFLRNAHAARQLPRQSQKARRIDSAERGADLEAVRDDARDWVEIEALRLRAATLSRRPKDELEGIVAALFEYIVRIRSPAEEAERRRDQSEEEKAVGYVETLLHMAEVPSRTINAILSYWTTTSRFSHTLLFTNRFLSLRGQLRDYDKIFARSLGSQESAQEEHKEPEEAYREEPDEIIQARDTYARLTKTPHIWVSLLKAAWKYGNISLCEKLWLAACEDEVEAVTRQRPWSLPVAAYTMMLRVYEGEARRENRVLVRDGCWQGVHRSPGSDSDSGQEEVRPADYYTTHSRALQWERKNILEDGQRPCAVLAWQVYSRLAETQPSLQPDEAFFHAAMRAFYHTGHAGASMRRAPDGRRILRRLKRKASDQQLNTPDGFAQTRPLSMVLRDAAEAGVRIPLVLAIQSRTGTNGVYQVPQEATVRQVGSTSALRTGTIAVNNRDDRALSPRKSRRWAAKMRTVRLRRILRRTQRKSERSHSNLDTLIAE